MPFDLGLPSPSTCVPTFAAATAMAEVDQTSAATTGDQPILASILTPLQHNLDALQHQINDLRAVVASLIKDIKDIKALKQVKAETVSGVSFHFPPLSVWIRHSRFRFASVHIGTPSILLFSLDHRFHLPLCDGIQSDTFHPFLDMGTVFRLR